MMALLAIGAAAPFRALAQQHGKVWRIGVLSPDPADTPNAKFLLREFPQALQRHGYVEGRNLRIEWRRHHPSVDSRARRPADRVKTLII